MSIATAITAAQGRVANAYTAVSTKGGTIPATQNLTNLPNAILSIPSGGGGGGETVEVKAVGTSSAVPGDKVILIPTTNPTEPYEKMYPYYAYPNQTTNYTLEAITGFVKSNKGVNPYGDTVLEVETVQDPSYIWTNIDVVIGMTVTVTEGDPT